MFIQYGLAIVADVLCMELRVKAANLRDSERKAEMAVVQIKSLWREIQSSISMPPTLGTLEDLWQPPQAYVQWRWCQ